MLARGNPSAVQPAGARFTVRPRPQAAWYGTGLEGAQRRQFRYRGRGPRPARATRPLPPLEDPILHPPPLTVTLATAPTPPTTRTRFMHTGWLHAAMGF